MARRSLLAALIAAALLPASAAAQVKDTCEPAGQQAAALCYGGDVVTRDGQAYADPGRFESAIQAYEKSWTHRALAFQYSLANDVGMTNAPWLGTHNSFNSIAQQGPALSTSDANQQLTLVDQLRMDMRSLELDVHWFPSARAGGQNAPVVCHAGAASDHDGCSTEPLLGPVLDQIAGWLRAHRTQVLLLYIEDHLSGGGYPAGVAAIKQSLGSMVYGTGSTSCTELPANLTRDDVLAAGAQVVIVANSGCGEGADWRSLAFSWRNHFEGGPNDFLATPPCGYKRSDYDTRLIRFYEDSTWLSTGVSAFSGGEESPGLTPEIVKAMVRCGVDLFGFDQLQPGDGRNEAAVWSWATGQPGSGGCTEMRGDGRWYSLSCRQKRPAACRRADDSWLVTGKAVTPAKASSACSAEGATFDTPRTGRDNDLLRQEAAGRRVLLLTGS
ncbi:MAG TPA: hypothetical protein VF066_00895 [Thermoleophilaceae bacterium]